MFFNFKVCLTTCLCKSKELNMGSHEFSQNLEQLLQMVSHDLWAQN